MLAGVVVLVVTLVLDQISKWIVIRELGPGANRDEVEVIPGVLDLIFVRNTGSAFGLFQGNSEILKIGSLLAVIVLVIFYVRTAVRDWLMSVALGLQLGGALGNIVDRFRFGYVVDWIDLPRWPTFNIADSAITVGVALLAWALLFRNADPGERRGDNPQFVYRRSSRATGDEA